MALDIATDTPLAKALQDTVQSKLAEAGWSTDSVEDCALAEYIVLLLVNRKSQEEVANDVKDMVEGCDANQANEFARWLFEQARALNQESASNQSQTGPVPPNQPANSSHQGTLQDMSSDNQDMSMDDAGSHSQAPSIPTGPRSMSARMGKNRTRGQRILGQVNNAMDRTSPPTLHRIKGAAGAGRINTHDRQPQRGPRGLQQMPARPNFMNAMAMTPEQQMQVLAAYEEQARILYEVFSPDLNPNSPMRNFLPRNMNSRQSAPQPGKSLFERIDSSSVRDSAQSTMNGSSSFPQGSANVQSDVSSSMEVESGVRPDPSNTVCKFNLSCTRADCNFVHQSPAAPPGVSIDFHDTCSFGVACKNRKCVGKHPSPAGKGSHLSEIDCKYFPNCTNPKCPYKHPSMPPCRNGADCTVANCKFSHSKVVCKYDPCLNPLCPFKHAEGQKRGVFQDKVWINPDDEENKHGHVSERKFVDSENVEEDLVLPGQEIAEQDPLHEGVVA